MNPRSRIQKGKDFENKVAEAIQQMGLGKARREIGSGSGKMKGDIFCNIPFMIEAKNQKVVKMQEWVQQAQEQSRIGNADSNKWALVIKNPKSPNANPEMWVTIDFYEFLELLKKYSEPRIKEPDRSLKWKLTRLKDITNQVIKEL
jgi:hypothetical protein